MTLDESVKELIETLAAPLATNVLSLGHHGDAATGTEPSTTPMESSRLCGTTPQDEHLRERVVKLLTEWHLAGDARNVPSTMPIGFPHLGQNIMASVSPIPSFVNDPMQLDIEIRSFKDAVERLGIIGRWRSRFRR